VFQKKTSTNLQQQRQQQQQERIEVSIQPLSLIRYAAKTAEKAVLNELSIAAIA